MITLGESPMPYIKKKIDRNQVMITSFDSLVEPESIARIIDFFVDHVDLMKMGFQRAEANAGGRGCYPPSNLMKLYLYGYRRGIRSSRKLEAACKTNLEVIWLMDGLQPDFRTISDFRKDNIACMKKVFKEFTKRISVDLDTGYVSIDGSKFKAWNSKDRNFTAMKLDDRIKWLEDHTEEYLRQIEIADENEETGNGSLTKEELEKKLEEAQKRLDQYKFYRDLMIKHNLTQISLTDPDCRLMKNKNGMDTAYNVQTAVDTETHLMMDYQMTNRNTDHGLMASTMEEIKKGAGDEIIEALADKGYQQPEDMIECLEKGIIPNVILPDGQETYELEIEYEEKGCDKSSKSTEEIKKCLHNGIVPDVYEEVIEKIEVVETKKKVVDEPAEMAEPYATEEEMKERAGEGFYVRDPERDKVHCPGGAVLRHKSVKKNGDTRYANKTACRKCPYRNRCISGKGQWKEIDFNKDTLEKKAAWWNPEGPEGPEGPGKEPKKGKKEKWHFEKKKVVRIKFRPSREKMELRKCTSEHPFGTIKRAMGASYFLLKGKKKVDGEFALFATGYNLSRAENMFRFEELMEKVGREAA